jgi:transitional endoplasmic reticulum ATPase
MLPNFLFSREKPSAGHPSSTVAPEQAGALTDFLLVEESSRHHNPTSEYTSHFSARTTSTDIAIRSALSNHHPHLTLTACLDYNFDILGYSNAGHVTLTPWKKDLSFLTKLSFVPSPRRADGPGKVGESIDFGRFDLETKGGAKWIYYHATWTEGYSFIRANYFLHEKVHENEVKEFVLSCCAWTLELHEEILVFNGGFWSKDHNLWTSVQKADWKDVILDDGMKKRLRDDVGNFFSNKETYEELGVPWKVCFAPPQCESVC